MIPPEFLTRLRDAVPISDVVAKHLKLSKAGREFKAPCPFHNEKTPSFYVNDTKGMFHCFGCAAHGDVIEFLMRHASISFTDAVQHLAVTAGLEMPAVSPADRKAQARRRDLYSVVEMAAAWYEQQLAGAEGAAARSYLAGRGLTEETIARFRLGWAPPGGKALVRHLTSRGVDLADALEAGVLVRPEAGGDVHAFFRRRVTFPIGDARGRVVGFGGRLIEGEGPKYLNTGDTPLFHKGELLYGMTRMRNAVREGQPAILVEGYMDVVALVQAGFDGAVAPLGTAVTDAQLRRLFKSAPGESVFEPVLIFDGDDAGRRAALRAIDRVLPVLAPGRSVRFAAPPPGEDPDSLLRAGGREAFAPVLDAAIPLAEQMWQAETSDRPKDTPEQRAAIVQAVEQRLAAITDATVRQAYAADYAGRLETLLGQRPTLLAAETSERRSQTARSWATRSEQDIAAAMAAARALWVSRRPLARTPAGAWLSYVGGDPDRAWPTLGAGDAEYVFVRQGLDPLFLGPQPVLMGGMARWSADGGATVRAVIVQYLAPDGRPASLIDPVTSRQLPNRQVIGDSRGAALRLTPLAGEALVVATGLRVGLQAHLARPSAAVWVVDGVRGAQQLVLPPTVRTLTLVGVDHAKEAQLQRVVSEIRATGRTVRAAFLRPPEAAKAQV